MSKLQISLGKTLSYTPGSTVNAGTAVLVGALLGVAEAEILANKLGALQIEGEYELPKATGAIAQGAQLYWDDTAKNLTTTASGNTACGKATAAALSGDATAKILLNR